MQNDDMVQCPLIQNENIDIGDCVVYSDIAAGMFNEECLPERFRKMDDWREVCKKCKYHNM